jgi:hypothetical protein
MSNGAGDDSGGYFRLIERIVVVYGVLLAAAVAIGFFAWSQIKEATPGGDAEVSVLEPPPPPPVPTRSVEGASARTWFGPEAGLTEGIAWALGMSGFSSQYTPTKWSAHRATGRPDVFPERSDHPEAWAPLAKDAGIEWITLTWPAGHKARALTFAETLNPGAITRVDDVSDADAPVTLFSTQVPHVAPAGKMLRVDLAAPREITALRVVLDTRWVAGWNELDAVGLVTDDSLPEATVPPPPPAAREFPKAANAIEGATVIVDDRLPADARWATSVVRYSTTYSQGAWSPERALGAPDVWPASGDDNRAWATKRRDDGPEWLTLRVPKGPASSIVIVETFNPGTVVRVDALAEDGTATTLWQGKSPVAGPSQVLRVKLPAPREIDVVRVVLDTRVIPGWNELDAVGVTP